MAPFERVGGIYEIGSSQFSEYHRVYRILAIFATQPLCASVGLRWRVPADLDALRRTCVSRRSRRIRAGPAGSLDHDERGPDRRWHPHAGWDLPADIPQACLSGEMPRTSGFHPPFLG